MFTLKSDTSCSLCFGLQQNKKQNNMFETIHVAFTNSIPSTASSKLELVPSLAGNYTQIKFSQKRLVVTGCHLGNPFPGQPMKTSQANSADFLLLSGEHVPAEGKYTNKTNSLSLSSPRKFPASSNEFFLFLNS